MTIGDAISNLKNAEITGEEKECQYVKGHLNCVIENLTRYQDITSTDAELPESVAVLIRNINSSYPSYKLNAIWIRNLTMAVLNIFRYDACKKHIENNPKELDGETISKWITIFTALGTLIFCLGAVILNALNIINIENINNFWDKLATGITVYGACIAIIVSAIAGICNFIIRKKHDKNNEYSADELLAVKYENKPIRLWLMSPAAYKIAKIQRELATISKDLRQHIEEARKQWAESKQREEEILATQKAQFKEEQKQWAESKQREENMLVTQKAQFKEEQKQFAESKQRQEDMLQRQEDMLATQKAQFKEEQKQWAETRKREELKWEKTQKDNAEMKKDNAEMKDDMKALILRVEESNPNNPILKEYKQEINELKGTIHCVKKYGSTADAYLDQVYSMDSELCSKVTYLKFANDIVKVGLSPQDYPDTFLTDYFPQLRFIEFERPNDGQPKYILEKNLFRHAANIKIFGAEYVKDINERCFEGVKTKDDRQFLIDKGFNESIYANDEINKIFGEN